MMLLEEEEEEVEALLHLHHFYVEEEPWNRQIWRSPLLGRKSFSNGGRLGG